MVGSFYENSSFQTGIDFHGIYYKGIYLVKTFRPLKSESEISQKIMGRKCLGYLSAAPRVSTNPEAEASGPRSHVLGVIQAFRELGWEVVPFIVGDRIPLMATKNSAMKMEHNFLTRLMADGLRLISGPIRAIEAWFLLHGKVDMVYERFAVLQSMGWIFQPRIPWILESSGLYYYEATIERKSLVLVKVAEWLEKWAYRKCDVLICVSEALRDLIIRETGISTKKIIVVPNGVDCVRFDPEQTRANRLFSGPTIGFASALVRWHRLDILIQVIADLQKDGINYHLIVAGDGPMREEWEELANQSGLKDTSKFLGHITWDEIPAFMAGCDLGYVGNNPMDIGVMYHSPLKMFEYMAMAKPVVSTYNDDSRDMVRHGENGYLFEPGNPDDLKRVLIEAFGKQNIWEEMGRKARIRILENASWTFRVSNMLESLSTFLENRIKCSNLSGLL